MEVSNLQSPAGVLQPPPRLRWGPWATLAWGLGAGAVMVATQTLGVAAYMMWQHATHPENPIPIKELSTNGVALTWAFFISAPFLLGFIALAVRLSRQDFAEYLGLRWPSLQHILMGVVAIGAVLILSGLAASFFDVDSPAFTTETLATAQASGMLPFYIFAFAVLAPIQEEIVFRGFLYRGLAPALGPAPAIILLSAVWAVLHVQYAWFFVGEIFLLGMVFGWLRWFSGSTLLTLLLHATLNGLAMVEAAGLMDCA